MIFIIAFIAAIAGFLFGYDEGIIAGSLHLVVAHFDMSEAQIGMMTSALPFGALFGSMLIGSLLASKLVGRISRRGTIWVAGICFLGGALWAAGATSDLHLTIARFILGLAIGIAAVCTPLYIAEVSPAKWRGALVAMYQLAVTIGILIAYIVNYILVKHDAWRAMFASAAIPALCLMVGIMLLPESPRWLLATGNKARAIAALIRLRRSEKVDDEVNEIEQSIALEQQTTKGPSLLSRKMLPVLSLGVILFCLQQLSGINVIIYYAPIIFKHLGFTSIVTQILATIGIGVVNVAVTILSLFLIDKVGRRKLLLIGFSGTALSLGTLSVIYFVGMHELGYLSVLCLAVYIFAFAISLGPIPYIAMSEIFPLKVRGAGMSIASVSNWGFNGLVVFSFPLMLQAIGIGHVFACYAAVCVIGIVYTYLFMPETKNLSLEAIEQHTLSGKPLRELGRV